MSIFNESDTLMVPPYIKLLFDNSQLRLMKTLCLLYAGYSKSKKFYKVQDISFYYSLVNFDLLRVFDLNNNSEDVSRNLYYRFNQNINQIILELSNLKFVEVKGDINTNVYDLGIKLTKEGNEFIEGLEIDYFLELIEKYSNVISTVESNATNKNLLKGGV